MVRPTFVFASLILIASYTASAADEPAPSQPPAATGAESAPGPAAISTAPLGPEAAKLLSECLSPCRPCASPLWTPNMYGDVVGNRPISVLLFRPGVPGVPGVPAVPGTPGVPAVPPTTRRISDLLQGDVDEGRGNATFRVESLVPSNVLTRQSGQPITFLGHAGGHSAGDSGHRQRESAGHRSLNSTATRPPPIPSVWSPAT